MTLAVDETLNPKSTNQSTIDFRVSLPMLKMLDQLLSQGCFDVLIGMEE